MNSGNRRTLVTLLASTLLAATAALAVSNDTPSSESGYAPVNGLKMYYECHGGGEPLILLHGGLGAAGMFDPIFPALSRNRRVIAVDLQAHGHTADIARPMSLDAMAGDVAEFIRFLKLEKADVMGYSMGGEVALRTAILHPEVVRKLVLVSTTFKRDGWYPEIIAGMTQLGPEAAEPMKKTPMYQLYERIAPRPNDWPVLLTKFGNMSRKDYDWSKDVPTLPMPVLLVSGDADAVRPAHTIEFFDLLGGGKKDGGWGGSGMSKSRLAILPGLTHYTMFTSPLLVLAVTPFLDGPMPPPTQSAHTQTGK